MSSSIHVHSTYSVHDSTQSPEDIVLRAKELNINNITLTDHGTLLGIESFMDAGKKHHINTVPGVETYITNRNHLILLAKNYEGYQSISYAMKEANNHIELRKKLIYPIMTDEILEKYFKENDNVIATTACIQGPIATILLYNFKIQKKIDKEKALLQEVCFYYKKWNELNEEYQNLVKKVRELKKERTTNKKYTNDAYKKKIEKLKATFSNLQVDDPKYVKIQNELEFAENSFKVATDVVNYLDKEIKLTEGQRKFKKIERDNYEKEKNKYKKIKKRLNEINLYDENELYSLAKQRILYFKTIFSNFYIELQYHGLEEEKYVMPLLVKLAEETNTKIIAANDAHMKDNSPESIEARRIVRYNYFEKSQEVNDVDKELYIKTDAELIKALSQIIDKQKAIEAVTNTQILEECCVTFPDEEHYPAFHGDISFDQLIDEARNKKIMEGTWSNEYEKRLQHEIRIIKNMGYVDYHMIVRDFCNEARILGKIPKNQYGNIPENFEQIHKWIESNHFNDGIGVGPGRGSAVGSLVCYMLNITDIDPIKYNLLFERFLNPERVSMPDIDSDIKTSIRSLVIKYIKWKYGENAVCSIATETTYGPKNAIQMVGRDRAAQLYQAFSKVEGDKKRKEYLYGKTYYLSDMIQDEKSLADAEERILPKINNDNELVLLWNRAKLIEGSLSGTGVHAGGVIISDNANVNDYIPLAWNNEKKVWVAQCNKKKAEQKGLLKMDLLGLNTLDVISDCLYLIKKYKGVSIDINKIDFEEDVIREIYATGRTNSVFQFESPGMKSMLKDFRPTCFEDLIILVACYRPGPKQYLENIIAIKNGQAEASYKTDALKPILSTTYGSIVYQEQVMQIFQDLAGYSLGGADLVRRAMSSKDTEKLNKERKAFVYGDCERNIDGCINHGISENVANELFDEIIDFAHYAFNKSHAAAYAVVSYQTAWLKYHYPSEFLCSMFNNKTDIEKFAPIYEDCDTYGIQVLQPDINSSFYDFVLEGKNIRFGLGSIKGIGQENEEYINDICKNRSIARYSSLQDYFKRNLVYKENKISIIPDKKVYESLVNAGVFDSLGYNRKFLIEDFNPNLSIEISKDKDMEKLILEKISQLSVDKNNNDILYCIDQDIKHLGKILSTNPLESYNEDSFYNCVPIEELVDQKKIGRAHV